MDQTMDKNESVSLCSSSSHFSQRCTISLVSLVALSRSHTGLSSWSRYLWGSVQWSDGNVSSSRSVKKSVKISSPMLKQPSHLSWQRSRSSEHLTSIFRFLRHISSHQESLVPWLMNMENMDFRVVQSRLSLWLGYLHSPFRQYSPEQYLSHSKQFFSKIL